MLNNRLSRLLRSRGRNTYRPYAVVAREALRNEKLSPEARANRRRGFLQRGFALMLRPQWLAGATALAFDTIILPATAAQIRHFPDNTQLGRIRFGQFPEAVLNGKSIRLGAGVRILNQENLIVPPMAVYGKTYVVGYQTGPQDEIVRIWLLSEDEYRALRKKQR